MNRPLLNDEHAYPASIEIPPPLSTEIANEQMASDRFQSETNIRIFNIWQRAIFQFNQVTMPIDKNVIVLKPITADYWSKIMAKPFAERIWSTPERWQFGYILASMDVKLDLNSPKPNMWKVAHDLIVRVVPHSYDTCDDIINALKNKEVKFSIKGCFTKNIDTKKIEEIVIDDVVLLPV